jgi:hypothetical protein
LSTATSTPSVVASLLRAGRRVVLHDRTIVR